MCSLSFWTYLVEVGTAINFGISLRLTLMGSNGPVLQYCPSSQLAFWRQHPQHINEGGVKSLKLAIFLGVIQTGSEFLDPC